MELIQRKTWLRVLLDDETTRKWNLRLIIYRHVSFEVQMKFKSALVCFYGYLVAEEVHNKQRDKLL